MVAMLLVVAYAAGDNPATALQSNATQTASIRVPDVIAIETPSLVNNTWASTDSTTLHFLNGAVNNTVTSRSNGRIDVFIRSNTGSTIPHVNSTYSTDNLTNFEFRSNVTGSFVAFTTGFVRAIENWKIAQGTGPAGATISMPLRVTVPSFTDDGFYNSTVTYAAVRRGVTPV